MKRFAVGGVVAALLATGCAVVKSQYLRDDYDAVDKTRTKRLVVVTQPLPAGAQAVGELWSLIAQRHVNLRKNFLAKARVAQDGAAAAESFCGEGLEGVLLLVPTLSPQGDGMSAQVDAKLARCTDGETVWSAQAGGSWKSQDATLADTTAKYAAELGEVVAPYVAPSFHLLRATLDTLPNPELGDDDIVEKIELEE